MRACDERTEPSPEPEKPVGPVREEYEAPRVTFREPLEAVAGICQPTPPGKAVAGAGGCSTTQS